jgi:hypothetical protein
VDIGMVLFGLAMGAAIVIVWSRMSGRPLTFRIGNLLNAVIYVGGALLLRAAGAPSLVAYLWPLPVVGFVWLVRRRERRIA